MEFPHPSRPDYYGLTFSMRLKDSLAKCVDVLIPEDENYPSASDAMVVEFLESRSSSNDRERLEIIANLLASQQWSIVSMENFEREDNELFRWFRDFVYFGYYASNLVLVSLNKRGYAYHGAPQPLGYPTLRVQPEPIQTRGQFIPTSEVVYTHVQ